ncbi:MAG TPA: hypothetical protein VJ957_08825 [Longimicrobiales bacterium]|nr:hypothetical protein [Longimicrobiales bacterium]
MPWPLTRIVLFAFTAAVLLAELIQPFVPEGTAIRRTLQVLVASVAAIVAFRMYERYRGRP